MIWTFQTLSLVALGGAAGSVLRFSLSFLIQKWGLQSSGFPVGTLVVNMVGCGLMGMLMASLPLLSTESRMHYQALLAVGVLGGFTTFSAFSFEALTLFQQSGHLAMPMLYIAATLCGCMLAVTLGYALMR
jgi:CrcB protein